MFGFGEDKPSNKIDNLIGKDLTLNGAVEISGGTRLDGTINGDVTQKSEATLTVSVSGVIIGDVTVDHLILDGLITGDVTVQKTLTLLNGAVIRGDITYTSITVANGAVINGMMTKFTLKESNEL